MTDQRSTVWLSSYPKSGNTWLRALYAAWTTGLNPDLETLPGGPIASARQFIDAALCVSTADLTDDEVDALRPLADEVAAAQPTDGNGIHLRKIHDALFIGGAGSSVISARCTQSAIYVVRDPRDVVVSLAHATRRPLDTVVALLADPSASVGGQGPALLGQVRQRLGSWSQHVRSWTDQSAFPVLIVRYEDLASDPLRAWTRVLDFLALPRDEERAAFAVEVASFGALRRQERTRPFSERAAGQGNFFREGTSGQWRSLDPALARAVEQAHGEVMRQLGYLR